ncbi:MAG: hypothetical protein AB7I30_00855 [Isosphaeraceae bacterium]
MASLVKKIDEKIGENKAIKSFVVILTDDGENAAKTLKTIAETSGIKNVPMTIHQDAAGLPDYELAKDAEVSVTMWKGQQVKASLGFKGPLTDANVQTILAEIPKALGD